MNCPVEFLTDLSTLDWQQVDDNLQKLNEKVLGGDANTVHWL